MKGGSIDIQSSVGVEGGSRWTILQSTYAFLMWKKDMIVALYGRDRSPTTERPARTSL
jgi:hypothetical protein